MPQGAADLVIFGCYSFIHSQVAPTPKALSKNQRNLPTTRCSFSIYCNLTKQKRCICLCCLNVPTILDSLHIVNAPFYILKLAVLWWNFTHIIFSAHRMHWSICALIYLPCLYFILNNTFNILNACISHPSLIYIYIWQRGAKNKHSEL